MDSISTKHSQAKLRGRAELQLESSEEQQKRMCKCADFALEHEHKLNSLILFIRFLYGRLLDLKDG